MIAHLERWIVSIAEWWRRRWYPRPVSAHWIAEHTREDRP
jgi:hypothetical protein